MSYMENTQLFSDAVCDLRTKKLDGESYEEESFRLNLSNLDEEDLKDILHSEGCNTISELLLKVRKMIARP